MLESIRYLLRHSILDQDRDPLDSPVTLLVMLLHAVGFRWYGTEKEMPDGSKAVTPFLDTTMLFKDGKTRRKIVWNLIADDVREIGGDPVSIIQVCFAMGFSHQAPSSRLGRGAASVLSDIRAAGGPIWTDTMPYNDRGQGIHRAAQQVSLGESREILHAVLDLYRGFCWKLGAPADHPPHEEYGYPLDRHFRYVHGYRKGDLRQSLSHEQRMDELAALKLR